MSILPLIRKSDTWVSAEKAALMVNRSVDWVRKNTSKFTDFRRDTTKGKKGKKLEFELSAVIEVSQELNQQKSA